MNEGTTTEMLVRTESVSDRSVLPVSLRTEQVLDLHTKKIQKVAYKSAWYQRNKARLRERHTELMNAWRKANPEKVLAQQRRWRARHPDYVLANRKYKKDNRNKMTVYQAEWRRKNPEKRKAMSMRNYKLNPERVYRNAKAWQNKDIARLGDCYVRTKLSRGTHLPASAWPESLVELKRAQLKTIRLCRKSRTTTN